MGHEAGLAGEPGTADPVDVREVRIPFADGSGSLAADLYPACRADRAPTIVTMVPYRKDVAGGISYDHAFRWFARRGYNCLLVDCRGTGSSDGPALPPFAPEEADDALQVISWLELQDWCDGSVGMWGSSYGGMTAMKAAVRKPRGLKCIIAMVAMTDPELDFVHPAEGSSDLGPFAMWGANTLALQLLPPVRTPSRQDEQRWEERLNLSGSYLADLAEHGPGDPVWRERAIDAASVSVPTFCVGGWRDMCTDSMIRAYEAIPAPKKLIVGPWMHSQPQDSFVEPIDFLPIALRWWNHWLIGEETGILDEPPVTVYVQKSRPGWHALDRWPPSSTTAYWSRDSDVPELREMTDRAHRSADVEHIDSDPTVGALSGLWGVPSAGYGLPQDQQEDDARCLSLTTRPLDKGLLLVGRPHVEVTVSHRSGDSEAAQLFVRLTDVDPAGRSHLITAGASPVTEPGAIKIPLRATAYQVAAGHRVRVSLSTGDFPRIRPRPEAAELKITDVVVETPSPRDALERSLDLPPPAPRPVTSDDRYDPAWSIRPDRLNQRLEVVLGHDSSGRMPSGQVLRAHREVHAEVSKRAPADAAIRAHEELVVQRNGTTLARVGVDLHLSAGDLIAHAVVERNGLPVFEGGWSFRSAREPHGHETVSSELST
ncbi:CocE/NonD family hydrolase [Amycolatopsis tucumanensis]|uniref:CocE/NonD family hydrolase n=2 Tax=Amycolatopsis TaxID=1813 RepID=A0ABP7I773_9PSEU|nr:MULTISPECIES: CocE/NonD family hydrolase [Amycolatopsis]